MKETIIFCLVIIMSNAFTANTCIAAQWNFQKTYETGKLAERRISLHTTGDLKRNGKKELIVGYLNPYIDISVSDERDVRSDFKLYIFEWENKDLKPKFSKKWKYQGEHYYAGDMRIWDIGGRTIGETFPPYFAIEWRNEKYNFMEQKKGEHRLGSWVFPWLCKVFSANSPQGIILNGFHRCSYAATL